MASATPPYLVAKHLHKRFGTLQAVKDLSFEVRKGETLGLLGANGAGKTTAMRILAGLMPADQGEVWVGGLNAATQGRQIRQRLGVVTQQDGLDVEVSARQNLELFGYLCGLSGAQARRRASEVLDFFNLQQRGDDEVDELSGGMKRRLAIARALMSTPQAIILDEPSTGLDPHSRNQVWEKLAALKSTGVTALMSTHYMDEATVLCDRIALMDHGQILAQGSPHELIAQYAGDEVIELRAHDSERAAVREALQAMQAPWRELGAVFRLLQAPTDLSRLQQLPGVVIQRRAGNLEDVFLRLTGKGLHED